MFQSIFSNFKGNVLGGITAGIVALPLALAFGVQSGLGPSAGLYGAIFIGFFASLFGGTATQISGPTAPMTAVSMVVIASIIAVHNGKVAEALPYILMVFLAAGLFQIVLGFTGVGKYIRYIPYPVVSGFMTAIGVVILVTQLLPLTGYRSIEDKDLIDQFKPQAKEALISKMLQEQTKKGDFTLENVKQTVQKAEMITEDDILSEATVLAKSESSGVLGTLKSLPRAVKNLNVLEFLLALLTIVIIYGFRYITKKIPSTLVALLVVSFGAYFLKLDYRTIEQIPGGIPLPNLAVFTNFNFGQLSPYILTAITLAFLGAIDSLLTSVVADNMTKTKHNPNQELVGQGIGNSIAAIFGGIPGAGATIRTVVNINSGGTSKLSGMIAALLLLLILLTAGPIASQIPAAVLAGILVTVGIGVIDYKGLKAIPKMQKSEVFIMLVVLLLSVFWNLVYAVGIGFILAAIVFMKKIGDLAATHSQVLSLDRKSDLEKPWKDELQVPDELSQSIFVKRLRGPLFFGYTSEFQKLSKEIQQEARYVIIRMGEVPYMDQSGLYAMEEVLLNLKLREIQPVFESLQEQPSVLLRSIDIIPDLVPEENLFPDFKSAVKWIAQEGESVPSRE